MLINRITKQDVPANPIKLFEIWFDKAVKENLPMAKIMIFATNDIRNIPTSRGMLLQHFNEQGFVFYANYSSPKFNAIDINTVTSLLFVWPEHNRQVRIEGKLKKHRKRIRIGSMRINQNYLNC